MMIVSFTTDVKAEIAANQLHTCCMRAELSAVLQMCSTMNFDSSGLHLTVKTEKCDNCENEFISF